jgi:formylglycine-generating enzyme required for sulfatase activity
MQSRNIMFEPEGYGDTPLYTNSWALVAGVNEYKWIDPLGFAVADAEAVAELLPALEFSHVCLLRNAEVTGSNIWDNLNEMKAQMGDNDRLLIHFACHGAAVKTPDGSQGYLLLHNSKIHGKLPRGRNSFLDRPPDNAFHMRSFLTEVAALPARHKLIIVDSCFSGYMARKRRKSDYVPPALESCFADYATHVLAAGTYRQEAVEYDQYQHGLFTHHLVKGLKGEADRARKGWFTFTQLAEYVKSGVMNDTVGSGQGEFVFEVGRKGEVWKEPLEQPVLPEVAPPPPKEPIDPNAPFLDEFVRAELIEQCERAFRKAERLSAMGRISEARIVLEEAFRLMPDYPGLLGRLEAIKQRESAQAPVYRRNVIDGQTYVLVWPGDFLMGAVPDDAAAGPEEKPRRRVRVSRSFWISQSPITVEAYRKYWPGAAQLTRQPVQPTLPMTGVTWEEAARFCRHSGGRLPTEAEWEYAARGGAEGLRFPWGNLVRPRPKRITEVGQPRQNVFGLMDVCGNVREWCADFFDDNYYRSRPDPDVDPQGPANGHRRVVRGGSFLSDPVTHRLSARDGRVSRVVESFDDVGFRCVIREEDFCPA